jgi:hypothetical protein
VPTAAKLPWSLSNPQWVNQLTVKHAFQNTCSSGQKVAAIQTVLTRNKPGHDGEIMGKERRRLAIQRSNGLLAGTTRKLFRKRKLAE